MTVYITVFATLAAVVHVVFFYLESVAWKRPTVWKLFGVQSQEHAEIIRPMAFNQGFYNLFLGIGLFIGTMLYGSGMTEAGLAISIFALVSMLLAAGVLLMTDKKLWQGALVQGLLPLISLVMFLVAQVL
ncbi:MAG: DUF1304 domain-containing protein [Microbacteriaceae bacterium]